MSDQPKNARAMSALDAMATLWAATFDLRLAVKSMMRLPDGEDRLVAFVKQGHAEGLYAGRTSHQPAAQSAELAALIKDANQYCRLLSLLGMEEEGDPVAEVERLRQRLEDANKCVGQWIDAEARVRTTLGVENAALRVEIARLKARSEDEIDADLAQAIVELRTDHGNAVGVLLAIERTLGQPGVTAAMVLDEHSPVRDGLRDVLAKANLKA